MKTRATKLSAHDRWVCLDCRWTAKAPRRSPPSAHACPRCREAMLWSGTAFRPPRRDDDAAWDVVAALLRAGHRYLATQRRRRMPRTAAEVGPWLLEQESARAFEPERAVTIARTREGAVVRAGRRILVDRERVLAWIDGAWHEATLRLRGDGARAIATPMLRLEAPRRIVPVTSRSRIRVQAP